MTKRWSYLEIFWLPSGHGAYGTFWVSYCYSNAFGKYSILHHNTVL